MEGLLLAVELEQFKIGDLIKYIYYDWEETQIVGGSERSSIGFILDIIEDPDEKQIDLFPKVLIYDTRMQRTILTHSYNIEFISRA
mgnify:FL=1